MTIELGRREILGGLIGAAATPALGGAAEAVQPGGSRDPDLGPNVFIFLVNGVGAAARRGAVRQTLVRYPVG